MKYFLLLSLFSFSSFALEVSFDRSHEISEVTIQGNAYVGCYENGRYNRNVYQCYSSNLIGGDYSKVLVTDDKIDADYVKISRVGGKYIKGLRFNSEKGETNKAINLWVGSLFQRPVLVRGINIIKYRFFKNKVEVSSGEFEVRVKKEEDRYCHNRNLSYGSFCPSYASACRDFFYYQNYCK